MDQWCPTRVTREPPGWKFQTEEDPTGKHLRAWPSEEAASLVFTWPAEHPDSLKHFVMRSKRLCNVFKSSPAHLNIQKILHPKSSSPVGTENLIASNLLPDEGCLYPMFVDRKTPMFKLSRMCIIPVPNTMIQASVNITIIYDIDWKKWEQVFSWFSWLSSLLLLWTASSSVQLFSWS